MSFGWKVLIPASLVWIMIVADVPHVFRTTSNNRTPWFVGVGDRRSAIVLRHPDDRSRAEERAENARTRRNATKMASAPTLDASPGRRGPQGAPRVLAGAVSGERRLPSSPPYPTEPATELSRRPATIGGRRLMSSIFDRVKGFGVTFGTMFKKVTTELYPEVKKPTAPRYHGRHVLNRHDDGLEKCVGCELCAWACPADAIYVEGADNDRGRALLAG